MNTGTAYFDGPCKTEMSALMTTGAHTHFTDRYRQFGFRNKTRHFIETPQNEGIKI